MKKSKKIKKELKDYLHLYLGCDVKMESGFGTICMVGILGSDEQKFRVLQNGMSVSQSLNFNSDKPILRPLSDMTEDEEYEYYKIKGGNAFDNFEGETTRHLLSKHFDIFGLIEAGLAIDATKIKK